MLFGCTLCMHLRGWSTFWLRMIDGLRFFDQRTITQWKALRTFEFDTAAHLTSSTAGFLFLILYKLRKFFSTEARVRDNSSKGGDRWSCNICGFSEQIHVTESCTLHIYWNTVCSSSFLGLRLDSRACSTSSRTNSLHTLMWRARGKEIKPQEAFAALLRCKLISCILQLFTLGFIEPHTSPIPRRSY